MKPFDYFKHQAKNLHRDYKSQISSFDASLNMHLYVYHPKYFDIDSLVSDYGIDEEKFTLMNAQHIIAQLVGFVKWQEMLKASDHEVELAKLLFDNMHKISAEEWYEYISRVESDNNVTFDAKRKLEIFKQVFANVEGHQSLYTDYRLNPNQSPVTKIEEPLVRMPKNYSIKITSLPLKGKHRGDFIEAADRVFEDIISRMQPNHPDIIRKLWNVEFYIDKVLLRLDMLPIDMEYALSMIDTFLAHDVLELVIQADKIAVNLN